MDKGVVVRRIAMRVVALALATSVAAADSGVAVVQTPSEASKRPEAKGEDGRRTLRRLPANLGRGIVSVFHQDAIIPLAIGGAAAVGASAFDDRVRDSIDTSPGQGWGHTFGIAAGAGWSAAFVGTLFTAGRISHGTRFRAATYDLLDAAVLNATYSQALKLAVGRERPDGSNSRSLPSGHTSNAFTLATVVERHYGWKVGVPSYLLAGVIGASRIRENKHYLSDVVAGATVGYIVGRSVFRVNSRPLADGPGQGVAVTVTPIVGRRARGMQMSVTF